MPVAKGNYVRIREKDFQDTVRFFNEAAEAFGDRWLKNTQARRAQKHFVEPMKSTSPFRRFAQSDVISVTTAKKETGRRGVKVGVIKNDKSWFPDFSAPALAKVLEHGTEERFRQTGVFSAESTGSITAKPWLRPVWDTNVQPFMEDVERSIEKKFDKETR